jgi:c-di-GMP-binding flagellar brake protein YcgR
MLPGGDALDGRSEDISEGGLLVLAPKRVENASEVLVRFALPRDGRMVSMPAETRWVRSAAGREALGLRFLDPSEKVRADIRAYVEYLARPVDPLDRR